MEYFIPDTEFEKADFKGVRADPPPQPSAKTDAPAHKKPQRPDPNQTHTGPSAAASRKRTRPQSPDITQIMGTSSKKAAEPEARAYRLRDASGKLVSDSQVRQKDTQKKQPPMPRPSTRTLGRPKTPSEARKEALQKAHAPNAFEPARLTKADLAASKKRPPAAAEGAPISPKLGLLGEAVLLNLSGARHVLRRWYWEKQGQAQAAVAGIPPHDRIAIVLRLCGMPVLQKLFATMSPKEREQMVEILKKPVRNFRGSEAIVQSAFMQAMTEQDHWS